MNIRRCPQTAALLALAFALSPRPARAEDWPNWRGPTHDGISQETGWFVPWPAGGPKPAWKAAVGTGFSSVSVSRGSLFTMGNAKGITTSGVETNLDTVYCLDALTGAEKWKFSYPCPLDPNLYEGGPNATPTVEGDKVYTLSKHGHLFCFDASTGKVIWEKNLLRDLGVKKPEWGFASSPRIDGDRLLLNLGEAGTAVDKHSGQVLWSSGKGPAAYATPVLFDAGGKRRAVFLGHRDLFCVDVAEGTVWWRLPWKTGYDMSSPDAVLVADGIFISSWDQPGRLLQYTEQPPREAWQLKEFRQHINPAVAVDGFLYGFHGDAKENRGIKCVDARTGQEKWSAPNLPCGSLMASDGKLIILAGKGELIIAETTPAGFKPLSRAQVLGGKCWTVPVLANGKIYCRNAQGDLICLAANGK